MIFLILFIILLIYFYNLNQYEAFDKNNDKLFIDLDNIKYDLQSYGNCSLGSYPKQHFRWYNPSSNFTEYQCYQIAKQSDTKWLGTKKSLSLPYGCLSSNNLHYGTGILFNNEQTNINCGLSHNDWGSVNCLCNKRKLNL